MLRSISMSLAQKGPSVKDVIGALRVPLPGEEYRRQLNMRGPGFAMSPSAIAIISLFIVVFVVLNIPETWRIIIGWITGTRIGDEL